MKSLCFSILYLFVINPVLAQNEQDPFANGASLILVDSGYNFTEGPAVDQDGNVYFTDQPNDRILRWIAESGIVEIFMEGTGRSNGLFFDTNGNLLACADQDNELWEIDSNRKVSKLVKDFRGKRLNGPNDLWVDKNGGIYFTDPYYKRKYWTRSEKEIESENVYYLNADRSSIRVVANGLVRPNGIIGSKNGKNLFVADIGDKKTYRYKIKRDGSLKRRSLFVEMGSDGMTIDERGNVYLTGKGVTVFDRRGKKIGHLDVPENWTANVCFGGKDRDKLFITAMGSVYMIAMDVRGV